MLFRLDNVGKEYGGDWLFRSTTAQCNPGDRVGLIGRNGCGKTTLFDLIEGRKTSDEGQLYRSGNLRISRIDQIARLDPEKSLREEVLQVFEPLMRLERRIHELEVQMSEARETVSEEVAAEYESSRLRFRLEGGYDYPARTDAVLHGLGFPSDAFANPCGQLSGGQQSRILLAKALLESADLLLLDEPTNHLDIQGILWLTEYLREQKNSFMVISHDRRFLDRVTQRTWEIEGGKLYDYAGPFSKARELRRERLELEYKEYEKQQEWKAKTEDYIRRNIAGQKTRQAQSRRKRLARTDWLAKPSEDRESLKLRIPEASRGGASTFRIEKATVGYPGNALLNDVNLTVRRSERIGIIGGNGSGKTTLLKTLMGEIPPLKGYIDWGVNNFPAYYSQNPEIGNGGRTVYDCLRDLDRVCTDEELRDFAARFLFKEEDVFKKVSQLSGGERSRLALARLFFHPANVVIMDEPTNHLDIQSREALEEALNDYDGTLVIVSHDLYFLNCVLDQFYVIRDGRLIQEENLEEVQAELEGRDIPRREPVREQPEEKAPEPEKPAAPALSKNERLRRERRLLELEARIEALEIRKGETVTALQEQYQDFNELHRLSEIHEQIDQELADLYQEWEEQSAELNA